jgi:disulfide oxidoreductase YuzD
MTEKYNWYNAALRRKKIAEAKRLKAARYVDEMNKRANEQHTPSDIRHSS